MHAGRSTWPKNNGVRLPSSIIPTKIFLIVNNLVSQLGLHLPTLNLPCFTREIVRFLLVHYPSSS
jgi:hypothetical protein